MSLGSGGVVGPPGFIYSGGVVGGRWVLHVLVAVRGQLSLEPKCLRPPFSYVILPLLISVDSLGVPVKLLLCSHPLIDHPPVVCVWGFPPRCFFQP